MDAPSIMDMLSCVNISVYSRQNNRPLFIIPSLIPSTRVWERDLRYKINLASRVLCVFLMDSCTNTMLVLSIDYLCILQLIIYTVPMVDIIQESYGFHL